MAFMGLKLKGRNDLLSEMGALLDSGVGLECTAIKLAAGLLGLLAARRVAVWATIWPSKPSLKGS